MVVFLIYEDSYWHDTNGAEIKDKCNIRNCLVAESIVYISCLHRTCPTCVAHVPYQPMNDSSLVQL